VRIFGSELVDDEDNDIFKSKLAMEMADCSLHDEINKLVATGRYFTTAEMVNISGTMVTEFAYLEKNGVVHYDIKLGNFLLFKGQDGFELKITDLGAAHEVSEKHNATKTLKMISAVGHHAACFTEPFADPRCILLVT